MANPWDNDPVVQPARLGQFGSGNIDLTNRPRVKNPDGSISTVRSMSANFDGQEVLLPTVSDDGRIMSDDEAIDQYRKSGRFLGKFGTVDEANAYADRLHREQEQMYTESGNPWDADPIVDEYQGGDGPGLNIDIVGGVRESLAKAGQRAVQKEVVPPAASPDGWQPGMGRDAAFGARSVIQGAGGLLGAVGGDAFNNYVANPIARQLGMQEARPYRQEAKALADRIGLPQAQTSGDRILGDVGEALTGTGLTLGIGGGINALAGLAPRAAAPAAGNQLSQLLTAQPGMQALSAAGGSAASSATREAGGSEGNQLLAGLAGGLGPGLARAAGGATTRGLVRGSSGEQMRNTLADFEALGATPSVGQASGNRLVQGAENVLAGGPTSAGVMTRFAERQADDIGEGLQNMAGGISRNPSAERAGRAIERGVDTFNNNVGATRRALYWQADQFIPDATQTPMQNTLRTAVALTTPDPQAAATTGGLIQPGIAALRQNLEADLAANGGQLTYGALRRIRSEIGEQIGNASPLNPPADIRELNRLYGALSEDMRAAARSQGPEAVAAANRANNYTRASAERLETMRRVVEKAGGPEKVYSAVMAGTRDGGTTLRSVMQSLPPEGQRSVTAAVIRRMGMANPGVQDAAGETFSAQTFLRKWNDVSPEAKRALFDRFGPGFTRDVDRIAHVAQNIRDGARVFANPSGTANRAAAMTYGGSLVASLFDPSLVTTGGLIAGGIGSNVVGRLMTNPAVVRQLARATTMPTGGVLATARNLHQIAQEEGDQDVEQLAKYLAENAQAQDNQGGNNR